MVNGSIAGQASVSAERAGSEDCAVAVIESPELPALEPYIHPPEQTAGALPCLRSTPLVVALDLESVLVRKSGRRCLEPLGLAASHSQPAISPTTAL